MNNSINIQAHHFHKRSKDKIDIFKKNSYRKAQERFHRLIQLKNARILNLTENGQEKKLVLTRNNK